MADSRRPEQRSSAPAGGRNTAPELGHGQDGGHGHSTAAWTAVGLIIAGCLVMAVAMMTAVVWLFVVGAVVAVIGPVVGRVLSAMGFGAPMTIAPERPLDERGRDSEAGGVR